jgi:GMP reductase
MFRFTNKKSLDYTDVNLIAQPGVVESRQEIPIEGHRLVVSAMTSIVCPEFLVAISRLPKELQPTVHIPRDQFAKNHIAYAADLGLQNIIVGIGLNTPELEGLAAKYKFQTVLIDVANGGIPQLPRKIKELKNDGITVIAGSVHSNSVSSRLLEAGADILRTGVGTGAVCITKNRTGFTRGPLTEILELAQHRDKNAKAVWFYPQLEILADGGFKDSGDVCKAFLAGANYCMSGRLFVDAQEARLRVEGSNLYYGMASKHGKKDFGNSQLFIEGKSELLPRDNVRPLEVILRELWDGIRSAVSYSGYKTLTDAIGNGVFEIKER